MSSVVKQLMYVLKLFRVNSGIIHSFRIRSKQTLRIMYPRYPVLDIAQRIHLRWGSFGSITRFFYFSQETKDPFSFYGEGKGDLTRDDSQRRFLAQQSVAMLREQ